MDYTGRIITKNPQTPSANGAPGVWTLDEAMQYSKQGKWPPGYQISRSVRLRSSASAYFNRTTGSPTSSFTFTHSFWVKRGALGAGTTLISGARPTNFDRIYIQSNDALLYQWNDGTSNLAYVETTQVFRDPSAWYHILIATDTTQATASNRVKIYVNGTQVTALTSTTYPSQNSTSYFNTNAVTLNIGRSTNATFYLDGYLTEINFIDGQALTPASFGYFDTYTGVWQPAPYTGTYGNNGFYLTFADNSAATAAAIGKDYSGNGNNWTPNNISVTAGTTYDSMVDVPINWGTDTGAGGVVRGNYCVSNPVENTSLTMSNGNLTVTNGSAAWYNVRSTFGITSGKWYWEGTITSGIYMAIGIATSAAANTGYIISNAYSYANDGTKNINGTNSAYGATFTTNDIIGIAFDADAGTLTFYKNNSSQGTATTGLTSGPYFPWVALYSTTMNVNFGQRPFAYTAPSGYKALCTQNISVPTVLNGANYMAATLYSGTGGTLTISNGANNTIGTTFQPDWVWVKSRSAATDHKLTDSVRGATKALISDSTGGETTDTNGVTAFGTTGFTLGSDTVYNNSGATYVGWQWKASGSTVSNTSGSITSTVSANPTAGFSVVSFTGNSSNSTVGHGLGIAPSMVILKSRGSATSWGVYHVGVGNTAALIFNSTAALNTSSTFFQNTTPTSTVFSIGNDSSVNASQAMIAYCFAPITGFSAFGSYTGNGSTDGPFVYCGFRPRWVMVKRSDAAGGRWATADTSRSPYNVGSQMLYADAANAEDPGGGATYDIISNGFKIRAIDGNWNTSGGTYVFVAFAENPFTIARAR